VVNASTERKRDEEAAQCRETRLSTPLLFLSKNVYSFELLLYHYIYHFFPLNNYTNFFFSLV